MKYFCGFGGWQEAILSVNTKVNTNFLDKYQPNRTIEGVGMYIATYK